VADKADGLTVMRLTQLLGAFNSWSSAQMSRSSSAIAIFPVTSAQRRLVRELLNRPLALAIRPVNKTRILLCGADIRRLRREAWLSDELMNAFSVLISHRSRAAAYRDVASRSFDHSPPPRAVMFSTFFFSRMSPRSCFVAYNCVSRWGVNLGLDLTAVDVVLVPVLFSDSHWVLVAINVGAREFHFSDSPSMEDSRGTVLMLKQWLHQEVDARFGHDLAVEWDVADWWVVLEFALLRQTDSGSCGLFVLDAADCFSLGVPMMYSHGSIGAVRRRITLALFFDDLEFPDNIPDNIRDNVPEPTSTSGTTTPAMSDDESVEKNDAVAEDGAELGDAEHGVGEDVGDTGSKRGEVAAVSGNDDGGSVCGVG